MGGDSYRGVEDSILNAMNRGASMSGMDLTAKAHGLGAFGGDRGDVTRGLSNRGYLEAAGDQISKLRYGALRDARNTARGLQEGRETSAGRFGQSALANLGIGEKGVSSRFGAFKGDRDYQDRDLGVTYKNWLDKKNDPWKKLSYASGMFSGMPIEEKGMTQSPASGGK